MRRGGMGPERVVEVGRVSGRVLGSEGSEVGAEMGESVGRW